jgi:hypothetical protein
MTDILGSIAALFFGALVLALSAKSLSRVEQRYLALSFAAHILAAIAQIVISQGVYGGGDNITYMTQGSFLARGIEINPERFVPLWVDLLLQREWDEVLPIQGAGSGTGTMVALVAGLALVFRYSLYGACLSVAILAFVGKVALYRVFRELLPQAVRVRMLVAALLMPSAVFWSSGIQKEAFVIAGIGPVWLGVHRILRGRPILGVVYALVGALPIGLLKPYTLFALAVAAGAWVGVDRLQVRSGGSGPVRIRPAYLVLSAALIYGGVIALGQLFPSYSVDNLGEDLARHQYLGHVTGGGSSYAMGDGAAMSLQKQLAFAPLAVATSLFRPFPFEANNALAFAASLETLVLTGVVVRLLFRTGPRAALTAIMSTPVLFASLLFAVTFGMAVGLATTNFGSLSRYRMPLIPFYATAVLVLAAGPVLGRIKAATPTAAVKRVLDGRRPAHGRQTRGSRPPVPQLQRHSRSKA